MPEVVVVIVMDAQDADELLARPPIQKLVDQGRCVRMNPLRGDTLEVEGDGYKATVVGKKAGGK